MKRKLILGLVMGLGAAANLHAIQIAPTYQLFNVDSGKSQDGTFTLTNNEEEQLTVSLSSKDWFVLPGNEKFKAADWLIFSTNSVILEPGEYKDVSFQVRAPKGAKGELVGMISLAVESEIPSDLKKVLSVAIYVGINGTEKIKANLRAIMVSPSTGTLNFSILLVNEGNVHVRPAGWVNIRNAKGVELAKIFVEQGRPAYPGREMVYDGKTVQLNLKPGIYKAQIQLEDVDWKKPILDETKKFEVYDDYRVELR